MHCEIYYFQGAHFCAFATDPLKLCPAFVTGKLVYKPSQWSLSKEDAIWDHRFGNMYRLPGDTVGRGAVNMG